MPAEPHIVWICQWYPHEGEPYAGDFIQRHAQAASLFLKVTTFACFVHTTDKIETHTNGNLTEHVIYFRPTKTGIPILNKILSFRKWYQLLKQHVQKFIVSKGKPDLLHCHIILNTGFIGLWAKKKYKIPYLVSEHWSGYMPGAVNGFDAYNPWSKRMCSTILKGAAIATGVSNSLIENLQKIQSQATYIRVPNVVNEQIFYSSVSKKSEDTFRIIHISTFAPQKNMDEMFTAFDAFAAEDAAVEFHIVGPQERLAKRWLNKKFSSHYIFHKEIPQQKLAALMQTCDVCVLYSNYETFGCVIIEANAIGLPVIVSDIPVLREIVHQGVNGVLVSLSVPGNLQKSLSDVINRKHLFNPLEISDNTLNKYAYEPVGKQIFNLYESVMNDKKR